MQTSDNAAIANGDWNGLTHGRARVHPDVHRYHSRLLETACARLSTGPIVSAGGTELNMDDLREAGTCMHLKAELYDDRGFSLKASF